MTFKLQRRNEVRRRIENVLWLAPAVQAQQQCDKSGNDGGVADGIEVQSAAVLFGDKPDLRLTATNAVFIRAQFIRKIRQTSPHVDQILIAIHPVLEHFEVFDEFLLRDLYFVAHMYAINIAVKEN